MNIKHFLSAFLSLLLLSDLVMGQQERDGQPIPLTKEVQAAVLKPLDGIKPLRTGQIDHHIDSSGHYALFGDVFANKQQVALTEFDNDSGFSCLGFSIFKAGKWIPAAAFDLPIEWDPNGRVSEDELGSVNPVTKAFWTMDLAGERLVIVAGEVGKYRQEFYVLHLNPRSQAPQVVGQASEMPSTVDKYIVLYTCSPRLSEWENWEFYRCDSRWLVHQGGWNEFVSVNVDQDGDESETACSYDQKGIAKGRYEIRTSNGAEEYKIKRVTPGAARSPRVLGEAKVTFVWPKGKSYDATSESGAEMEFMFERFTGIPRGLYPSTDLPKSSLILEKDAALKASGDPVIMSALRASSIKLAR